MSLWLYDPFRDSALAPRPAQRRRLFDPFWPTIPQPWGILDSFLDDANQLRLRANAGKLSIEKDGSFQYAVDTAGFQPEEIKVDLEGNEVVVTGEHSENRDGESVHRSFHRRVLLPEGSDQQSLKCDLDSAGRLTVSGVRKALPAADKRTLPINVVPQNNSAAPAGNGQGNSAA